MPAVGILLLYTTSTNATRYGIVQYRAASTPHIAIVAGGTALEVTTSDVTGTTGTDGKFTISSTATAVKIENRLGGATSFGYFAIG